MPDSELQPNLESRNVNSGNRDLGDLDLSCGFSVRVGIYQCAPCFKMFQQVASRLASARPER